jgi:hypothetical protein
MTGGDDRAAQLGGVGARREHCAVQGIGIHVVTLLTTSLDPKLATSNR